MRKFEIWGKNSEKLLRELGIEHAFFYEETDSTNIRAKAFHSERADLKHGMAIFVADYQTSGRGTRSRSFESPRGAGLYISFLFYPDMLASEAAKITTYAAVTVRRALSRLGADPKIKWVNDIYLGDKKISGILTEGAAGTDGRLEYAIVGIGINIRKGALSPELADIAASLEDFGVLTDRDSLAYIICEEFFSSLDSLGSEKIMDEYRLESMLVGRRVKIITASGEKYATVLGIDADGALITDDESGKRERHLSADVSIKLN